MTASGDDETNREEKPAVVEDRYRRQPSLSTTSLALTGLNFSFASLVGPLAHRA
jgi:hypothetical protein